jgi:multiple antibiotic resistance protein
MLEFALLSFTSLFTMVNPLGVVPIYVSMTGTLDPDQTRATARKAVITALLLLLSFAVTGQLIFSFFGISVNSLRIVGGVIFFIIGFDMLQARLSRTKHDTEAVSEYVTDIAITPLAIPMICGPGAIATVIVLASDASSPPLLLILFLVVLAVMGLTYVMLRSGDRIIKVLGDSGNKVMLRLMGLIVMVIAVEFFFGGLEPILQDILMLEPEQ